MTSYGASIQTTTNDKNTSVRTYKTSRKSCRGTGRNTSKRRGTGSCRVNNNGATYGICPRECVYKSRNCGGPPIDRATDINITSVSPAKNGTDRDRRPICPVAVDHKSMSVVVDWEYRTDS